MASYFTAIGWTPGIGDPSVLGWLTVVAYFYCAYLAFKVSRHCFSKSDAWRERALWFGVFVFLLLLGINKQLDLQSFFTASLKYHAHQSGWYEQRRLFQVAFIAVIGTLASVSALV